MRVIFLITLFIGLQSRGAYLGDISTTHSVTNLTALQALVVPDKTPVLLKGYYVEGDAPAVTYVFVAGDTSTVDNGSVVTNAAGRFKLQPQGGRVDIRTFGAVGDWLKIGAVWTNTAGVTNITLASAPATNYVGKKIALRRGNTSVGAEVTVTLAADAVSSFTVVSNGQGYINVPTNVLVSGPGSGATTTCVLTNGRLSSITVGAGGSGYTAASVFKIRSLDAGTVTAPFYTELFSVSNQVGTTIGLSGTPTFSDPLNYDPANPYAEVGAAALYTDNQVSIQAAADYAAAHGLEVYIPQGDFGTGPVYLNAGQKIVGGGRELARLHSAAKIGFTTFRKSVLAPKNINTVNGRQLADSLMGNVEISGFTIDGSAPFQSPMGTDLNNGSFAVFGINCVAVDNWHIHDMVITNCQGGAIYYGSFAPTAGTGGDWTLVQSRYIKTDHCLFQGNWRQAHQLGNVIRLVEDSCDIIDSAVGYYYCNISRNLTTGSSVGNNNTYSPEQIDAEANSSATSGNNKFVNCWMQNAYGKAVDLYFDQQHTDFIDCTFKDNLLGSVTGSVPVHANTQNNQDGGAEWTTFQGCRFFSTSTNNGPHMILKGRGQKVLGCYFEGKTGNTTQGNGDIVLDASGYTQAPNYWFRGNMFVNNTINLYPTDGTTTEGVIQVFGSTLNNVNDFIWRDNVILAGLTDMRIGTDKSISDFATIAGTVGQEGYAYQSAAGGNPNYLSESSTAGLGSQDWTILMRYARNSATTANGELFRWNSGSTAEIRIWDKWAVAGSFLQIDWNPNGVGSRSISVPASVVREAFPAQRQFMRPVNLTVRKTHGSVYKIAVTAGGSGYTASTSLALTFASSTAAGFAQTDSSGVVTNAFVSAASSGLTTNPVVSLTIGGGSSATFTASAGKIDVLLDDVVVYTDYGIDVITNMSASASNIRISSSSGTQGRAWYAYGVWNKALTEDQLRQAFVFGPAVADQWGTPGGTTGCITYIKFNPGIGYFFEDPSSQAMHQWCGQAITHGFPKRSGQLKKHLAVTTTTGGTNSFNVALAASAVIPANARITSVYVIPQSGAAPTVRLGFDSAITDQLVAPVTLTANTTNYLSLAPSMVYGSTNRPVYFGQTGPATNDIVINYSLDEGGVDGSMIQSGIVTAPGGLGSTSAIAATAIDATGWTNTFGVNAMVYAEGTGLQYTVYNAAGTPVYTNAATVGSASIALQKGGKVIVIAGTGVSGRAVPW